MNLKIDDISKVIKDQIKTYSDKLQQDEVGYVIQVGDGIAKVHGLENARPMSCCFLKTTPTAWR